MAELILVRGGILLLLLLVAIQAHARIGYEQTLKRLQERLAQEDAADGVPLYVAEVPKHIVGWPTRTVEQDRHWQKVTYRWKGLNRAFEISMPYDTSEEQPAILGITTAEPPPIDERIAAEEPAPSGAPEMAGMGPGMGGGTGGGMGGGNGGGMGGGNGGGQRRDIMENDADKDGKVSREEAPERMQQFFDRVDTNADGFIDVNEAAEMRNRRPGGGRPQGIDRPEEESPADAQPGTPAARPEEESADSPATPSASLPADAAKPQPTPADAPEAAPATDADKAPALESAAAPE